MALKNLESKTAFDRALAEGDSVKVIGFFGDFSATSRAALPAFEAFCAAHPELATYAVDVGRLRNVHKDLGVTAVPTVVAVRGRQAIRQVVGFQTAEYYGRALLSQGAAPSKDGADGQKRHSVTVYSTPTCSWCTRLKNYLRKQGVAFRDVDVSRDERAAAELVRRSGQMGVPQTDIDGTIVVGFDQGRIDRLLGLAAKAA